MSQLTITLYCAAFFGGGTLGPFSLVPYLLQRDAPDFGSAIRILEIKAIFADRSPKIQIPEMAHYREIFNDKHSKSLDKPAKLRLDRANQIFQLEYMSAIDSVTLFQSCGSEVNDVPRQSDVQLLDIFYRELLANLDKMQAKIKPEDDFDIQSFVSWAHKKQQDLPIDADALSIMKVQKSEWGLSQFLGSQVPVPTSNTELVALMTKRVRQELAATWETIEVDWKKFHADARKILDEPFYWNTLDETSPHGSDEGADLLSSFQKWRKKNKQKASGPFLDEFLLGWGLDPENSDPFGMVDAATIGLAFAHLKVDGGCPADVKEKALAAIESQFADTARYVDPEERKEALKKMKAKLLTAPELVLK